MMRRMLVYEVVIYMDHDDAEPRRRCVYLLPWGSRDDALLRCIGDTLKNLGLASHMVVRQLGEVGLLPDPVQETVSVEGSLSL